MSENVPEPPNLWKGCTTGADLIPTLDLDEEDEFELFNADRSKRVTGLWDVDGNYQLFVFSRPSRSAVRLADSAVHKARAECKSLSEKLSNISNDPWPGEVEEDGAIATGPGLVRDIFEEQGIPFQVKARSTSDGLFPSSDEARGR
ncbi:MAG: hypothetical protein KGJ23_09500 [Euryarchaeota archaeon]|nr:hypothetical protein [Euryarchaeota archaeon]MDE2044821.1 hypothetical protein [Thermoplasmata archaeon]